MSSAKTDISTAEKEYQAFRDQLDMLDQVRDCVLWPPQSDFSKVCSCDECCPKIERLNQFEKEIKAKRKLISAYQSQMENKEHLCLSIFSSAEWTKRTLGFFQKKLKAVSEKSGVSWTLGKSSSAAKLEVIVEEIDQMVRGCDLLREDDDDYAFDDDDDEAYDVLRNMESGLYYYKNTKAKDKAYALIREIEKLEKDCEMDMITAKAQNKSIDPAISKKCIEKQIELLKTLPVEELKHEIKELIAEIHPIHVHMKMFLKAKQSTYIICGAIIVKRKMFWQKYSSLATKDNGHNSSELKETLDSLIDKVNSFEDQWKKEFAPFHSSWLIKT
ncbi:hypothetical protein CASFOL_003353 [Castilleja foliolosa]|uniref:Uncharacterized protein n=1 Tax=Castilleja foliolosa TaxID=1961234 RepID=A0ABD3EGX4_9LAMI